jgi:hypothetical protein
VVDGIGSERRTVVFLFSAVLLSDSLGQGTRRGYCIQGVSGGIVNILGGGSMDYSA